MKVEANNGRSESFVRIGPSRDFIMDYGFEIGARLGIVRSRQIRGRWHLGHDAASRRRDAVVDIDGEKKE